MSLICPGVPGIVSAGDWKVWSGMVPAAAFSTVVAGADGEEKDGDGNNSLVGVAWASRDSVLPPN